MYKVPSEQNNVSSADLMKPRPHRKHITQLRHRHRGGDRRIRPALTDTEIIELLIGQSKVIRLAAGPVRRGKKPRCSRLHLGHQIGQVAAG